jgi:hypothetical protein
MTKEKPVQDNRTDWLWRLWLQGLDTWNTLSEQQERALVRSMQYWSDRTGGQMAPAVHHVRRYVRWRSESRHLSLAALVVLARRWKTVRPFPE